MKIESDDINNISLRGMKKIKNNASYNHSSKYTSAKGTFSFTFLKTFWVEFMVAPNFNVLFSSFYYFMTNCTS